MGSTCVTFSQPVLVADLQQATIVLASANRKDKSSVFRVREVHVKVESLKFSIRDSKHDFLYKTLRPLASALIKRQLQKVIADVLRTLFEYVDGQLVTVRDRMEAAKATEGQSRTDVLKEVSLVSVTWIHSNHSHSCSREKAKSPSSRLRVSLTLRWLPTNAIRSSSGRGIQQVGLIAWLKRKRLQSVEVNGALMRRSELIDIWHILIASSSFNIV